MPKRRHKEGNGSVSSSGEEAEAWPPPQESSRPPSISQIASNEEEEANQSTSVGVIGPFGEDTSNEDLTEALKEAGFKGALAERIFKGKDKIKTSMFKVIFNSNSLPPYVRIGYQQYRVNTYIGKPWECYKCQRFGHSAAFCRSAPRCVVCSSPHTSNECNKTTGRICCNCGGNHTANYGGCPKIKQAKELEKTRQIQKLSYRDAVKQVLKLQHQHLNLNQCHLLTQLCQDNNQTLQSTDSKNTKNQDCWYPNH
ncbi:hypothetical protein FHG87_005767 [Trinorchestia longiramus]|nr:hypothetical protein FHG87_005767 [Trinorchestia longiramus]